MADEPWHLIHTNKTHISFDGVTTFNESLLNQFNYTIYSNGTLSNATKCVLAFDIYKPVMLYNGTILNGTKCDSPVDPIEVRGALGIAFAVLFAGIIMWGTVNLRKHGQSHLPVEKNFRLVSRRWPWYWLIVTAAIGCISGFMAIDVDRDYMPGAAIILQSFFYYVCLPTVLAAVWEMTRHWGSFEERKILDKDAFALKSDDRRSKIEFYTPLVFYLFAFMVRSIPSFFWPRTPPDSHTRRPSSFPSSVPGRPSQNNTSTHTHPPIDASKPHPSLPCLPP